MILAVDIGNSNIVIGCFDKNEIMFVERLSTNQLSTALEYTVMIKNMQFMRRLVRRPTRLFRDMSLWVR